MNRIDVMVDQTIEDIFIEHLNRRIPNCPFTLIRGALGNGASGPRMGTAVWPEENSLFMLYTPEEQTVIVGEMLAEMRKNHPNNGICAFVTPETRELTAETE